MVGGEQNSTHRGEREKQKERGKEGGLADPFRIRSLIRGLI